MFLKDYKPGWANVLRIALFAVFFLSLAEKIMPASLPETPFLHEPAQGTNVIPMLTLSEDPRGMRQDALPTDAKNLKIAWITDSAGVISPSGAPLLNFKNVEMKIDAAEVSKVLKQKYNVKNLDILLYSQVGGGAVNKAALVSHAITQKPDLIVLAVNPFNSYHYHRVFAVRRYMGFAAPFWLSNIDLAYLAPLFFSPSDFVWSALAPRFRIIYDSFPFREYIGSRVSLPGEKLPDANPHTYPDFVALSSYYFPEDVNYVFGTKMFEDLLSELKGSKIPSIIFLSPMAERYYSDTQGKAHITMMTDYLLQKQQAFKGTNINIIPEIPADIRNALPYCEDGFHLKGMGEFDGYLAAQVSRVLTQSGKLKK